MSNNSFVEIKGGFNFTIESNSVISSNFTSNEEVQVKQFGKEKVDDVISENEKLVFDGTIVRFASTQDSIELKNGAKIQEAQADSKIHAENCKDLGKLNAGGSIILSNCSTVQANAGGKIDAKNCTNVGHLNAGGKVELTNCTFGSANAGGKIQADNCQNFKKISAGGKVEITNSTVDIVSSGGQVDIRNTTIKKSLEFSQDSTIADSTVESIVVHPNCGSSGITIINGRLIGSPTPQSSANIYLENTVVKNIQFVTSGKVFLRGNSRITGNVVNGKILND